jgi:hypothetical protein
MQRTVNAGHLKDLEARRTVFASLFDEVGDRLPDAPRLEAMARRALAVNAIDTACRAYDAGRENDEPVDDYAALALDVYPTTPNLRQWRALQRRRAHVREQAVPVRGAQVHRAWRDLADRVTWRRWRWSGL